MTGVQTCALPIWNPPDHRATATALQRGIDLSGQSARKVKQQDFEHYDYILAMDEENHINLIRVAPEEYRHKIRMFLEFAADQSETEVPDPYYGGDGGFEHVLDLVQAASRGLLDEVVG